MAIAIALALLPPAGTPLASAQAVPVAQRPSRNPVLFVHGINATARMWCATNEPGDDPNLTVYAALLKVHPPDLLGLYEYPRRNEPRFTLPFLERKQAPEISPCPASRPDDPNGEDQSDSFGDMAQMASGLNARVDQLIETAANNYGHLYGTDKSRIKVDLVTHSQGGLLSRYYLTQDQPDANGRWPFQKIGHLVQIGTPNLGTIEADLATMLTEGCKSPLEAIVLATQSLGPAALCSFVLTAGLLPDLPDPSSLAVYQLKALNNPFLQQLNQKTLPPSAFPDPKPVLDVKYGAFYGDFAIRVQLPFMDEPIPLTPSIGDGVVGPGSATTITGAVEGKNLTTVPFRNRPVDLVLRMDVSGVGLRFEHVPEAVKSAADFFRTIFHTSLPNNPDVTGEIVRYLGSSVSSEQVGFEGETATALVIDRSGSMGDPSQGGSKIVAAHRAAASTLGLVEQSAQAIGRPQRAAIVGFSDDATILSDLTTDIPAARRALGDPRTPNSGLFRLPAGQTNLGAGLIAGLRTVKSAPTPARRTVVLLTDGLVTRGPTPPQILAGPVQEALASGVCIHTVGFGNPAGRGELDENLLRQIGHGSGCGSYSYARTGFELENSYVALRHEAIGNRLREFSGVVRQGATRDLGLIEVKPGQAELHATLNWPGSQVDLLLEDPLGRRITASSPNVTISNTRPAYWVIKNPLAGDWAVGVFGREVTGDGEPFDVLLSTRPLPPGAGASSVVLLTALMAAAGLAILLVQRSSPVARGAAAFLEVQSGPRAGVRLPLGRTSTRLGRSPRNEVVLTERSVSAQHAVIERGQDGFVVRDAGSSNGTFVNDQRVQARRLWEGDRLRLANVALLFRMPGQPSIRREPTRLSLAQARRSGPLVIGRERDCQLRLTADPRVSRRHAQVFARGEEIYVEDLGSGNGTFVNGERVTRQVVQAGDRLRVGRTELQVVP